MPPVGMTAFISRARNCTPRAVYCLSWYKSSGLLGMMEMFRNPIEFEQFGRRLSEMATKNSVRKLRLGRARVALVAVVALSPAAAIAATATVELVPDPAQIQTVAQPQGGQGTQGSGGHGTGGHADHGHAHGQGTGYCEPGRAHSAAYCRPGQHGPW